MKLGLPATTVICLALAGCSGAITVEPGGPGGSGASSSGATSGGGNGSGGNGSGGNGSGGTSNGGGSNGGGSNGGGSNGGTSGGTRHDLTVTRTGTGAGTVTASGIDCGTDCSGSYAAETAVTLSAAAATGSTFGGWAGACSGAAESCTVSMTVDRAVTATFSAHVTPSTFSNPVIWEDLADVDVFRVDDTYYFSASNMHYSPGAPVMRSYDLVNWEYAGHSVPVLDFSPAYDLNGGRAYIKGTWASFLNYRKSDRQFYWGGCIGGRTYLYTSPAAEGPWQRHATINNCYYDAGLLVDDDDTLYVSHGSTDIYVAQLSADARSQVRDQKVFTTPFYGEGSRIYKKDGSYYILLTQPASWEYVLRSTSGPFGPYEMRKLVDNIGSPVPGGGAPHQGGIVGTQNGDWYYMAFIDAYPGGRMPVLAPVTWVDGWPVVTAVNGKWGATYPYPNVPPSTRAVKPPFTVDTFEGTALGPEWEWNHNPDNARWSLGGGLVLRTATVTNDLYQARNTLTHRIRGPSSTGTVVLEYGAMKDGDRAGLALFRDSSAWVGVRRDGGATRVSMVNGLSMDSSWNTTSTGTEAASAPISGGTIWLRLAADIRPGPGRKARFSYSTDGTTFTPIGPEVTLGTAWQYFMGHRFGIFNHATQSLGGSVTVKSFELTSP